MQNLMNTFQLHLIWKPYAIYFKDLSLSLELICGIIVFPVCRSSDCQHSGICQGGSRVPMSIRGEKNDKRKHYASLSDITDTAVL